MHREEFANYGENTAYDVYADGTFKLTDKIEIVALNKIDAVDADELKKQKDRLKRAAKKTPLLLSGATGAGVKEALRKLADLIAEQPVSNKAKSAVESAATEEPWAAPTPPQG